MHSLGTPQAAGGILYTVRGRVPALVGLAFRLNPMAQLTPEIRKNEQKYYCTSIEKKKYVISYHTCWIGRIYSWANRKSHDQSESRIEGLKKSSSPTLPCMLLLGESEIRSLSFDKMLAKYVHTNMISGDISGIYTSTTTTGSSVNIVASEQQAFKQSFVIRASCWYRYSSAAAATAVSIRAMGSLLY